MPLLFSRNAGFTPTHVGTRPVLPSQRVHRHTCGDSRVGRNGWGVRDYTPDPTLLERVR